MLYLLAPKELTALLLLHQGEVKVSSPLSVSLDELAERAEESNQAGLNLRQIGLAVVQQDRLTLSPMGELLCQCLLAPDQTVRAGRTSAMRNGTIQYCAHKGLWAATTSDFALELEYVFFPMRTEDAVSHVQENLGFEPVGHTRSINLRLTISEALIFLLSQGVMARRVKDSQRLLGKDEMWFSVSDLFQGHVLEECLEIAGILPNTPSPETFVDGISSAPRVKNGLAGLFEKGLLEMRVASQGLSIFRYTPLALDHLTQDGLLDQAFVQNEEIQGYYHYRDTGILRVSEHEGMIHYESVQRIPWKQFFSATRKADSVAPAPRVAAFCSNCGNPLSGRGEFCGHCGIRVRAG